MVRNSMVSVYSVDPNGSTGALVGSGMLVDSLLVLATPPLDARLTSGDHPRLRLGIAAAAGVVEVLDVAHIRVSKGAGQVLVGLEPTAPAHSPPDVVDGLQDAHDADSLRAAGVAALEGQVDLATSGSAAGGSVHRPPGMTTFGQMSLGHNSLWCVMWGWGCKDR